MSKAVGTSLLLVCLLVFIPLAACGGSSPSEGTQTVKDSDNALAEGPGFSYPDKPPMPDTSSSEAIDVSHAKDGYVCARQESESRLKFQVSSGDATYNYDMPADGTVAVFPINMGDGDYLFRIMQNTEGSNYVEVARADASVTLSSEFAPFLMPNIFCNYSEKSACVAKAHELVSNAASEAEAIEAVCTYVVDNVTYDTDKAKKLSTTTGYIPDPDDTLSTGKGVCFDYASLGAAMLRSLGIPTKVVTGYVSPGDLYHAWIMIYSDGEWKSGEFSVDKNTWSRVDLTFASTGNTEFTGDGGSYTDRYIY